MRKKRNKRKKITQSKTLRKTRFPSKRNARNRQPIGMVDLNSQSSKQPIKCLRCLRFSFTHRTRRNAMPCVSCGFRLRNARNAIGSVACVALSWKPGLILVCKRYSLWEWLTFLRRWVLRECKFRRVHTKVKVLRFLPAAVILKVTQFFFVNRNENQAIHKTNVIII